MINAEKKLVRFNDLCFTVLLICIVGLCMCMFGVSIRSKKVTYFSTYLVTYVTSSMLTFILFLLHL